MDKCCDNCKYNAKEARESKRNTHYLCRELGEQLWRENWDTSKDFCSKWEEERINQILIDYYKRLQEKNKWCNSRNVIEPSEEKLVKYFKQRIEESLGNALECIPSKYEDQIYKAFDWALKKEE